MSELCGIINGYSHISVSGDRLAVHEHRHDKEKSITKTQVIEFDEAYFKGKDIYVFDDVVTTGASYAIFANQLEILTEMNKKKRPCVRYQTQGRFLLNASAFQPKRFDVLSKMHLRFE